MQITRIIAGVQARAMAAAKDVSGELATLFQGADAWVDARRAVDRHAVGFPMLDPD